MNKVVFFDRDGVLVRDPEDYRIDKIEKIEFFEDSVSALSVLAENGFSIVIITNQAGIEEGRLSEEEFWKIQDIIVKELEKSGINILKTYMNGEMNKPDASDWRKPGPNMLLDAAKDFNLDIGSVYMVGDNQSDITAALRAGCKGGILVKTATNKDVVSEDALYTAKTLTDAVNYIVSNFQA
ncbi:HAD-IIIA family hydrolase [Candidatus Nomurabacteria bacterium]|nr:HAD-IIIA family hydrolase [Candidatus Nomurabacteria bacterium]